MGGEFTQKISLMWGAGQCGVATPLPTSVGTSLGSLENSNTRLSSKGRLLKAVPGHYPSLASSVLPRLYTLGCFCPFICLGRLCALSSLSFRKATNKCGMKETNK